MDSNNFNDSMNSQENSCTNGQLTIGRDSLLVLFLVAFCFRLIYVIQSADNPLFGVPVIDARVYDDWAIRMAEGVWLWDYVGNYLPIYPAFLALQKILFGAEPLINKLTQSAMGALSAVLLAHIAALSWNRKIGLIAGYLIAFNWMLVVYGGEKFAECFSIFFMILTLWLLLYVSTRLWGLTAAGFSFALCVGARANLLLLLPFILWWLFKYRSSHIRLTILNALLFCIGAAVIIGPVIYRNYQIAGVPMLRAQATWSLYAGLAPEFEGLHPPVGILFDKYMHLPLQAGLRTEKEVERFWGKKVIKVVRENPGGVVIHLFKRFMVFFNAREWSQEFDVYAYRAYSKFLSLPWVGFWLIGPLGTLGLLILRKPSENQLLLAGSTIITFLSIIPFKASDRYRLPTSVLLTIFAAFAIWQIWQWYRVKDRQRVILAFIFLSFFCLLSWPDWPNLEHRQIARHDFHIAIHDGSAGRLDKALNHFKKSMQKFQWDPDSPYQIGRILLHKGQKEEGVAFLRQAIQREPHFPKAINEIARLHMVEGDLVSAEQLVKESLQLNPTGQDALLLLAGIYRRLGERKLELDTLEKAVLESKNHQAAVFVAERLIEFQKYHHAVELYKLVMNAHDAGRELRVKAAMLAGITSDRFLNKKNAGHEFYDVVIKDFGDFSFFDLQAKFLLGHITEEEFKKRMDKGNEWEAAAAYVIGLARWNRGDLNGAVAAYNLCLAKINLNGYTPPETLPQKWAWADLKKIKKQLHRR